MSGGSQRGPNTLIARTTDQHVLVLRHICQPVRGEYTQERVRQGRGERGESGKTDG
jgi:hypothetical protein